MWGVAYFIILSSFYSVKYIFSVIISSVMYKFIFSIRYKFIFSVIISFIFTVLFSVMYKFFIIGKNNFN